jgi:RNA polymerase sigma-54 factor
MSTKDLNEYIDSAVEANPFLKKVVISKEPDRFKNASYSNSRFSAEYFNRGCQQSENPRQFFLSQIRMLNLKSKTLEIAEYLIYEMDSNGYITVTLEEVAQDLSVSINDVKNCLTMIQNLDPPGIGARDVQECLQLQLKRINKENSLEYTIVSKYIGELARNDSAKISKMLNIDKQDVQKAIDNIKKLNPRPASTILSRGSERVIPDLIATVKNNKVHLELNRGWLPRLRLYNPYENKLDIIKDFETRKFLKEHMDSARYFVDNLKRREETMYRVANYILNFHQNELMSDTDKIKSLTIKDISQALNFHPSTINRAVSNKYVQINEKVMPLKNLLSHGIKKVNDETTSKTAIKTEIREMVKNEDRTNPLSDRLIQEKLEKEGIIIKRRTIAKFRNSMHILPAYLRRKA